MLHVDLGLAFDAGESGDEFGHALRFVVAQLLLVDEVVVGVAAAEKEQRATDCLTLRLERGPLLQKAAEGRQPCAWPSLRGRFGICFTT